MDKIKNTSNLIPIPITEEMKNAYIDYAMSVIVSRAIPDIRDGLKPVHRRILYAMYEAGNLVNKPHRKSARIVGDVIGKYHPHGDSAVYDTLVRMAQPFSLRAPLIDGQGNFGSMDGDAAAAMRYTESRLSKIAHSLLTDIDKNTVPFIPNYDGSENEPTVLPAEFPNLLVNGAGGIAVGMSTNIPPHNLGEVIDACCMYIENNNITIEEMLSVIKGPDFPTGGLIINKDNIKTIYSTGRGSIIFRGKCKVENIGDKQAIIITEMPYMVNKVKLIEKIADLVKNKIIDSISELNDESNKNGVRIVITLKKDSIAKIVMHQLYIHTQLQTTFGVNMLSLDNKVPKTMNLKEIIQSFIQFREIIITNRTICLLNKARDKAHILIGIRIAILNIDSIINIIKSASTPNEAKTKLLQILWSPTEDIINLIKLIGDNSNIKNDKMLFTINQVESILEIKLHKLTSLEKEKLDNNLKEISKDIEQFMSILRSREILMQTLKKELIEIRHQFSQPRKTEIINESSSDQVEDLILSEEMVLTITVGGYIKRVPLTTYKTQKRGGKGRSALSMKAEDVVTQILIGNTHSTILFFSNIGQVYSIKLYKLPLASLQSKGRSLINILPLKPKEKITNIMSMPENNKEIEKLNIIFASGKGNIRRNLLTDFIKIPANGKIAIKLEENDTLVNIQPCREDNHIFIATKSGKALRFPVNKLRIFKGRNSDGVRGIKLSKNDIVIGMTILRGIDDDNNKKDDIKDLLISNNNEKLINVSNDNTKIVPLEKIEEFILTITENGYGKITSVLNYRITNRGGTGIINMRTSEKTGNVVTSILATAHDEVMLITNNGKLIRCKLNSLRITNRGTSGVILFKTNKNEKVVSASLITDSLVE